MYKVFIDGSAGTTGLRIFDRLEKRKDIELLTISDKFRKDNNAKRDKLNSADIVFLCLPDDAAKESVSLIENKTVKVIDTSTAHRTNKNWVYGFCELTGQKEKIANSCRIANPGCHASGVVSLIEPLVKNGILRKDIKFTCFSITGYSGGGKKMIAEYEASKGETKNDLLFAPRQYGLSQNHKHLAEIVNVCSLENAPCFCPIVSDYFCGMEVTIPVFADDINGNVNDIKDCYKKYYQSQVVKYTDENEDGFLSAGVVAGKDCMYISVFGNAERILLVSRFDNLGKGASGAAIQNMNIALGIEETTGLLL